MKNLQSPYLVTKRVVTDRKYNPKFGDDRECICGHPYYRHFDTYDDMYPCGCKYCDCGEFQEKLPDGKVFLVRVHDYAVWEEDPRKPGHYHSYEEPGKEIKNRQEPYDHWNFDALVKSRDFVAITEAEVPEYLEKHDFHFGFISWQCRNDGHGGAQGGTMEEYLEHLESVKRFNEEHPNWKEDRDKRIKEAQDKRIKETYGNDT